MRALAGGEDGELDFYVGIDADVEEAAVGGEPGVGPAAEVADAEGGDGVDDVEGGRRLGLTREHTNIISAFRAVMDKGYFR